jgi:hypothetical protein
MKTGAYAHRVDRCAESCAPHEFDLTPAVRRRRDASVSDMRMSVQSEETTQNPSQ